MPPKVAIITRTKDRPLLLPRCLLSVVNQTCGDWVHVIVNDGGEPQAVEAAVAKLASRYNGRVKIIHHEKSVGMENASNAGIKSSESEYLVIHDDDDSWNPLFLEECVGYLDRAGANSSEQGVVTQTARVLEEIGDAGQIVEHQREDFMVLESISLFQMAGRNLFPPIAFLYRRKAHETIGYFDGNLKVLGDYDFNLRFLSHYDIGVIPQRLANYHWRQQATGSGYGNTVTDGVMEHRRAQVKLQNYYLRQDLTRQQVGLGFLISLAMSMNEQTARLAQLDTKVKELQLLAPASPEWKGKLEQVSQILSSPWKNKTLPRRAYDQLADWFKNKNAGQPSEKKNGCASRAELEASLRRAKVVSLDVFDTALLRLVRQPADVFLYIQPEARRLLNNPKLGFVQARIAAEVEAREQLRRAGKSGETTLDDIYRVLRAQLGCEETAAKQIQAWEIAAEQRLCFANPEMSRLAKWTADHERALVFSSDMYLPAVEITALLARNGFKNAPLFLSSELLVSKHEGGLFDRVVERVKCQPGELLHIGDNAHSDVARPRARGIKALHWARTEAQLPLVDQAGSFSGAWHGDLASSLYTGLVRRRRLRQPLANPEGRAFWEMIGYEVAGPLYHAFVNWAIEWAASQGLKKLFFLARDGFQLVKVFDRLRESQKLPIEGAYLFASRRLWGVARIERLDAENLAFLVKPNPRMSAADFLRRIGIDPAPHESLIQRCGFAELDERITTDTGEFTSPGHDANLRRLMWALEGPILEMGRQERKILVEYFHDAGLDGEGAGIVDIGWHASAVRVLQNLFPEKSRGIPGLYFGTWPITRAVVETGAHIESFFVHLGRPEYRAGILRESVEVLESLFYAPHPTIKGIEKKNGQWEPKYGATETDPETAAALETVAAAALEFVGDALAIWPRSAEVPPAYGYLETTLERLLRYPTKAEATALGNLSWRDSFSGAVPTVRLAKPPTGWESVRDEGRLQTAYDQCYWKRGFLAQLGERTREYVKP